MHSLSKKQLAYSRNIQAQILQSAAKQKHRFLAECVGVNTTTIGRWLDTSNKDSRLTQFALILAIFDLKVVPSDMQCYDRHKIDLLFQLAKDTFERLDSADDFFITPTYQGEGHE
ncbi:MULTISPECIES: hypothetical protein [Psychrobacter]|uniref:hypothetical protein n=1 Tax=Psychrobacter TaxID=497 RepID=UPI00146F268B|nr:MULTISPECIES: hypothetical protein [Psychrobacter]